MAAAHDSPGLKITVAAFLSLSVILSVALYFLYSAYSSAEARLQFALTQNREMVKAQRLLEAQNADLRLQISKRFESLAK